MQPLAGRPDLGETPPSVLLKHRIEERIVKAKRTDDLSRRHVQLRQSPATVFDLLKEICGRASTRQNAGRGTWGDGTHGFELLFVIAHPCKLAAKTAVDLRSVWMKDPGELVDLRFHGFAEDIGGLNQG